MKNPLENIIFDQSFFSISIYLSYRFCILISHANDNICIIYECIRRRGGTLELNTVGGKGKGWRKRAEGGGEGDWFPRNEFNWL